MFHLVYPALSRAAALDPLRVRHYALVASASAVALALLLSNTVPAALAAATENSQPPPASQIFVAVVDDDSAPLEGSSESATEGAMKAATEATPGATPVTDESVDAIVPIERPAREMFTVDVRPPLMYPVGANAPVGSPFGPRAKGCAACSTQHRGVDWNPGYGTSIVSIADGVVSAVGNPASAYGVHLLIDHVVNGQAVTSLYAHLQSGSIAVQVGDRVRVGDPVGLVGSTGVTTAPHLHFEIQVNGVAINPVPWMRANGAQ